MKIFLAMVILVLWFVGVVSMVGLILFAIFGLQTLLLIMGTTLVIFALVWAINVFAGLSK